MEVIKPDTRREKHNDFSLSIFLAGSIDMGNSIDWQQEIEERLKDREGIIYNPRRNSWDSSWEQKESNPQFNHQVNWELNMIENSSIVFMNFLENSMSPITLLELGYIASNDPSKLIVNCPRGFWRRGNVEIVCSRQGIPLFDDMEEAVSSLISRMEKLNF
jgi:hypothetical protein